jgi:hypothetical protein
MKLLSSKKELNDCLFSIIENSQDTLKIVSPFVDFWDKERWNDLIKLLNKKESIIEIYTKPESAKNKSADNIINALNINKNRIIPTHNLHAKIYINDNTALLSSMNLIFSSFNHSIDFGVVTETEAEYRTVLDYCNKYIFIYDKENREAIKKYVITYFSEKNIESEFYNEGNCLFLKKNGIQIMRCWTEGSYKNRNNVLFWMDVNNNNDKNKILNNCKVQKSSGMHGRGKYYITKENVCGNATLIPTINIYREEILGILVDVYNCIGETSNT